MIGGTLSTNINHLYIRQRLIESSRQYPWVKIVLVTEDYTSVTCGSCGLYNASLGMSKDFMCGMCGYEAADRDINAARNILLKFISEKE